MYGCIIGISCKDTYFDTSFCQKDNTFYAMDIDGDKVSNVNGFVKFETYHDKCWDGIKESDTITLELNLLKKTISSYINDEWKGIAFENIKTGADMKYKLAVFLVTEDDSCSIIDYHEEYLFCQ